MRIHALGLGLFVCACLDLVGCSDGGTPPGDDAGSDASMNDAGSNRDASTNEDAEVPDAGPFNPCDVDNGGCEHFCTTVDDVVSCDCDFGYALDPDGVHCAPDCAETCGENATCGVEDGVARCLCSEGMQDNDGDLDCSPACAESTCGDYATCDDSSGTLACVCDPGTSDPDQDRSCAPDCSGLSCDASDACMLLGGAARCVCDPSTRPGLYGGTASAGPGLTDGIAGNAFDGDSISQFNAIEPDVDWLMYDYGAGSSPVIQGFSLDAYASSASAMLSFRLEGSHDGGSFTTLDAHVRTLPVNGGTFVSRFPNTTGYRYYRLRFLSFETGYVRVQELKLNDCAVD